MRDARAIWLPPRPAGDTERGLRGQGGSAAGMLGACGAREVPGGGVYTVKIHAAITGGHAALSAGGHRCWGVARLLAEG